MQGTFILWLAALPLILAVLRAVTIGDRLHAPVQTGSAGGYHKQHINLLMAGLTFVALTLVLIATVQLGGVAEDTIALILMAFGAFVISAYLASGFRNRTWQKFVGHAVHEAGLFWLVLGVCNFIRISLTDREIPEGATPEQLAQLPNFVFLEGVVWAVITAVTLLLIVGTFARMIRR